MSLFPWYLRNGIINATEDDLENGSSSCERWGIFCGVLVVAAVVAELIIAWIEPPYKVFLTESAITDAAIALGIVGEVLFGMWDGRIQTELRNRSNKRVADATVRAAEATKIAEQAQLERLKLEERLAPRRLTKEQYDKLQNLGGVVGAVNITSMSGFESTRFATQIAKTLHDAGIDARICSQRIGLVWSELYVVLPEPIEDFRADPLYSALKDAGLSVGCGTRSQPSLSMRDLPPDIPVIMVGEKSLPPMDAPPYPFTVPPKTDGTGVIIP
jgi:hypothetical protein